MESGTIGMKVLLVRLSAHGDILQTLPVLAHMKAAYPTLHVGWLVELEGSSLLSDHPLIDTLHVIPRKTWLRDLKRGRLLSVGKAIWHTLHSLRQEGYTLAIDVQGLFKSAIWPWLMGIPYRLGFQASREYASLLYTHTVAPHNLTDTQTPIYQTFLRVWEGVQRIPKLKKALMPFASSDSEIFAPKTTPTTLYPYPEASMDEIAALRLTLQQQHWKADHVSLAMAPATKWESKCWPDAYWATLVQTLASQAPSVQCVFVGTVEDAKNFPLCHAAILAHPQGITMAGKTSLRTIFPLLQLMSVFIGGDSFAMHVAHVTQHQQYLKAQHLIPIIGLWGATAPLRTGSLFHQAHLALHHQPWLACQPCFKKRCLFDETLHPEKHLACLRALTPEKVYASLLPYLVAPSTYPTSETTMV
jgi:heptosyltransferase-1